MRRYQLSFFFVFSLFIWKSTSLRTTEKLNLCGTKAVQKCSDEHRQCNIDEDRIESCGQCQLGYFDFSNGMSACVKHSKINWKRFEKENNPCYRNIENSTGRLISETNSLTQNATYKLGLTPFSADTGVEYKQRSGYFYVNVSGTSDELTSFQPPTVATADVPSIVDWVAAGAVTSVKNQGRCGCSWAIGLCGAIEGAAYLVDGMNKSLSFQQFISCNKRNFGCGGGSTVIGAKYAAKNWFSGITTLSDYQFIDADGLTSTICNFTLAKPAHIVEVKDSITVAGLDKMINFDKRVETFKLALIEKPISIILKSSCELFSNYISGVLTDDGDCSCSDPACYDHSVLMVGYSDSDETPYFKFKNSWGTEWGEDGYFRVAQREKGPFGLFGIFGEGVIVEVQRNLTIGMEEIEDTLSRKWVFITFAILCSLCCCCCSYIGHICWVRNRKENP